MSDLLRKYPLLQQLLTLALLTMFFFGLVKPYVDGRDIEVYNKMEDRIIKDMEELIETNKEILNEIRGE